MDRAILEKIAAYAVSALTAAATGAWNPFPPGTVAHALLPPVAALLAAAATLWLHPNGVRGPAKGSEPIVLTTEAPKPPPEAGSIGLRLVLALPFIVCAFIALTGRARGDDSAPTQTKFGGGCFVTRHFGEMCAAPDVAVAVIAFRSEGPSAGVMPGAGYKVEAFAERWYTVGLGGYVALQSGSVSSGAVTGLLNFAHYVRMGVAKDLYAPGRGIYPVLGLGMDLGPSR